MADDITHPRIRVPRSDRSLLAIPELGKASDLLAANQHLFESSNCSLSGRDLVEIRALARQEALMLARSYTASVIQSDVPEVGTESLVVGGHQPELFHVGVWAKNFALAGVARQSNSLALNLVIDNDTFRGPAIRIPVGSRDALRIERMSFDTQAATQPWEEAVIHSRDTFERFGFAVRDRIRSSWGFDPLIGTAWPTAIQQSKISSRLCDALTALRTHVERQFGLTNLELPMSHLCTTKSFLWFVAHLLHRLPEVQAVYNETVVDYRRRYRLRNRMQPVPNLESTDGWLEAPFWIWRRGDRQRGRLFVRRSGADCELRDEREVVTRFPATDDGPLDRAVSVLQSLTPRGYRLRTRALTTTLFARVCLADLFLHGIGGAKYDEMTDRMCECLFGLKAPRFLTISATLHLPLGGAFTATEAELLQMNHRLRDLTYNPERHNADFPDAAKLIQQKNEILKAAKLLRQSHQIRGRLSGEQHRHLATINDALRSGIGEVKLQYETERNRLVSELTANSLITDREYSFVLYPKEQLQQFLLPLAGRSFERNGQEVKQ